MTKRSPRVEFPKNISNTKLKRPITKVITNATIKTPNRDHLIPPFISDLAISENELYLDVNDIRKANRVRPIDYSALANTLSPDAKEKFIIADNAYFEATGNHLIIESATRSVQRQEELYVARRWHNQGNPASRPGASFHNWGVALDLVMRHDEDRIVAAMESAGWNRTKANEPWHFEAITSPAHEYAKTAIARLRSPKGLTTKWWAEKNAEKIKEVDVNNKEEIYFKESDKYNVDNAAFEKRDIVYRESVNEFNAWQNKLDVYIEAYDRDLNEYEKSLREGEIWLREINNMEAGDVRETEVREYDSWADSMDRTYEELNKDEKYINEETKYRDQRYEILNAEYLYLEKEYKTLSSRFVTLENEEKIINKIKDEIVAHRLKSDSLLTEISKSVNP